jgi:radical SAM superfamily enzyme YgiQ (UPF0313 family)
MGITKMEVPRSNKKGKILFITHESYRDDNELQLGPPYLSALLTRAGHKVEVFSQDVFHQSNEELAQHLQESRPDVIGVGFLAANYKRTVKSLLDIVNGNKGKAKVILGGQGVSAIPTYVLRDTKADVGFLGEGERVILPLIDKLLAGASLNGQRGIAFREGNKVQVNPKQEPVKNLSELPFPQWNLFPMEEYATRYSFIGSEKGDRNMSVISSRGCVGKCSFCYRIEDSIRLREIDDVINELKTLNEEYGINYITFQDELFVASKRRVHDLTRAISGLNFDIKYYCQSRVELAKNKEILEMLVDSGCQFVNLGLESFDQNVLDRMNKKTKVSDNYAAVENIIAAGIHPGLNVMWGCPGDTPESLRKIVDFLIQYDTQGQLRTVRPTTPYPGCPLYHTAIAEGKLAGPADFFTRFKNPERMTVNFTNLSEREYYQVLLDANNRLIDNYYKKTKGDPHEATKIKDGFKKLYFPTCEEDLNMPDPRHYETKE